MNSYNDTGLLLSVFGCNFNIILIQHQRFLLENCSLKYKGVHRNFICRKDLKFVPTSQIDRAVGPFAFRRHSKTPSTFDIYRTKNFPSTQ